MARKRNTIPPYQPVCAMLKEMRNKAGLSQRALADKIGEGVWWVERCEMGTRRVDVSEFVKYCRACGVDVAKAVTELARQI
jgi:ribosome-binding protein aMBF1 (putative translation factor)